MPDDPVITPPPVVTPTVVADPPVVDPKVESKTPEPNAGEPVKTELGKAPEKVAEVVPFDAAKLTLPEGMKTDDPLFKSYTEIMGDDKLSPQDKAQKSIDLYHQAIKQAGEANTQAWSKVNETWVKEVKADPEIGGAKFDQTKATIARAIDALGPEKAAAFRQALDMTGAGNNPAIWRGLAFFANQLVEGKHVAGAPSGSGSAPAPKDFFPNSKMS